MPTIKMIATVEDKKLWRAAEDAAQEVGFEFEDIDNGFRLRKGSLAASIFLGAFIKYVDVKAVVSETKDGETKILFDWSSPWWTGLIGINRTKNAMNEFVKLLEEFIEESGGEVLKRTGP